jgi:hypothetical protein
LREIKGEWGEKKGEGKAHRYVEINDMIFRER